MTERFDALVIGAGMAGASLAAELGMDASVLLLEMEDQPGYHTTARSAACFIESYGNATVRKLNRASRRDLESPPSDVFTGSVLSPRGMLYLARPGNEGELQALLDVAPGVREIPLAEAKERVPILRTEALARTAIEPDAMDIDVNTLHQGHLKRLKRAGGRLLCEAPAERLSRDGGAWRVETRAGDFTAEVLVNAAGAWADRIAEAAGLAKIGLTPLRRSAVIVPPPEAHAVASWPATADIAEGFYFKPEAGRLLLSPADETPVEPHDAYPEDMDIAQGIDRFEQCVDFEVRRVERSWAGLRTFAPDRTPVAGFDQDGPGFFWLAGQGGFGIQTSPAMSKLAAGLIRGTGLPDELAALDFDPKAVDPSRFRAP